MTKLYYTLIDPLPCRKEMHQAEHRAGRKLLCEVLSCNEDEILVHDNGKPYLPGGPCFSISHSGGMVLLAVSDEGEVGCDVEPTNRVVRNEEAIRRKIAPGDKDTPLLKLWVAYEAMHKSGLGDTGQTHYPEMPEGYIAAMHLRCGSAVSLHPIKVHLQGEFL